MKIFNVDIFGLEKSMIRSGYSKKLEVLDINFPMLLENIDTHVNRVKKLGRCKSGSGHDVSLSGIIVQFDMQAPEYFWRQFDRYHFHNYISSQSKMYCILKFDITKICNKYVDVRAINLLNEKIQDYNAYPTQENFQYVISNTPMGLELTAGITSTYLQEKTIHSQRKNHKLMEWKYYTDWQEKLPMFMDIIGGLNE